MNSIETFYGHLVRMTTGLLKISIEHSFYLLHFVLQVTVEAVEKGIQVNLYSEKSCPGLLVFVLKVFEEMSLNVLEARVSCTGSFHLEAFGVEVL